MSKKQFLKRYHLIINKLRKKPTSFDEIASYLKKESELVQLYNRFGNFSR
ncbi:MAG TPA: hypothetical protein VGB44_07140 [Flavobacterium sp.]